jgi:hypothetical protein
MKKYISLITLFLTIGMGAYSQMTDENWNYLLIREDVVKPSMTTNYEASLTDLSEFLTVNNIQNVNYLTQLQDNYHFTHVTVLNDLSEIGGGIDAYISGDKASTEFNLIWSDLNEAIESFSYYVVKYEPELSFVTDGLVWLDEAPYRKWNYFYFKPGSENEVKDILKAWKNLYQNRGVKNGFRVFQGVVGIEQPVFILTTWAESPLDYQLNLQENINLLGEDGAVLWMAMMQLVRKVETVEGWYLPQYSFVPEFNLEK